ncbi:hypothetical protein HN014_14210 [Aquimarina sp. TRL1]|uniref:hypothetical protein n=1 Tax=Aquimarina sp. (strain TRL1) TaxID=2736252 RepID=UPI00158A37C2|nr:hypothetical protein [Aquimarina sp. TRL1]QKX06008.1 hypothetical protein HN014_14210 [Aquimarina sp. TRL1]
MSTIKFGIRSVRLKSYSLRELGLENEVNAKMRVEYRQNYFHLHFLPLFPTTKVLRLRKEDQQLYEIPEHIRTVIASQIKEKPKTPWYTFLGPIILLVGLTFYFGNLGIKNYQTKAYYKEKFNQTRDHSLQLLDSLDTHVYFKIRDTKRSFRTDGLYAKVENIYKDSIQLVKLHTDLKYDEDRLSYQVQKYYETYAANLPAEWVSIDTLKKAILREYGSSSKNKGIHIFETTMIIEEAASIYKEPYLVTDGKGVDYIKKQMSLRLKNYGCEAIISKIHLKKGMLKWDQEFPIDFSKYSSNTYSKLTIYATYENKEEEYEFIIDLRDDENMLHQYEVKGTLENGFKLKRIRSGSKRK